MEDILLDNNKIEESLISNRMKGYLKEMSNWGTYLAVLGFILGLYSIYNTIQSFSQFYEFVELYGDIYTRIMITTTISGIISFCTYFIPSVFLLKFSTKTKIALNSQNEVDFDLAFLNLKLFYKTLGIMLIISIALIVFTALYNFIL